MLYLIAIIFHRRIGKNDPTERGCHIESTLCPRLKGYVLFVSNKTGGGLRWFLVTFPVITETLEVVGHKLHLDI